jgi:hypothetical protein
MNSPQPIDNKQVIKSVESFLNNERQRNADFNETFDGTDLVKIYSLDSEIEVYEFPASELLFFADRDAYYYELNYWENGNAVAEHKEAIECLKTRNQVSIFKELADAVNRRRIAPFVGAGMSFACQYPTWKDALVQLKGRIEGVDSGAFDLAMASYDYLQAAQILWDADSTQLENYIRTTFSDGILTDGKAIGPVLHLPKICHGCVITTNFDAVLEAVYERRFEGYMHGIQAGNKFVPKLLKGDRCILKLHGDAEDRDSYVFTKKQYSLAYGDPLDFTKQLPKALRQIFVSHSLLFLGCGLEKDRTLDLFTEVMSKSEFEIPNHFAILPEPAAGSGESKTQKENRLLKLKINPIWYPNGKFELVEQLIKLLVDVSSGRIKV